MPHDYTVGNKDNITEAVHGLDIFTKNWCMNCEETKKQGEPVFRCDECGFSPIHNICIINQFVNSHVHDYPLDNFGSMTR